MLPMMDALSSTETLAWLPSSKHSAPPTPPPPAFFAILLLPERDMLPEAPSRKEMQPHRSRAVLPMIAAEPFMTKERVLVLPLTSTAACASTLLPEMLACN